MLSSIRTTGARSWILKQLTPVAQAQAQTQVVRKVVNAIRRINHFPVDSVVCFLNTHPLDSVIQPRNKRGQINLCPVDKCYQKKKPRCSLDSHIRLIALSTFRATLGWPRVKTSIRYVRALTNNWLNICLTV